MSVIKKTVLHTVGLLATAVLAGIASGVIASLAGGDPKAVATWCARAYVALAVVLPLGLWIVTATFFDQDRELYDSWGPTLAVTVVPAILGALAARVAFVGPATTAVAVIEPGLDRGGLVTAMAGAFGWAEVFAVVAMTVVGALLVAAWAKKRGAAIPGL
jgi:hypothetical protein